MKTGNLITDHELEEIHSDIITINIWLAFITLVILAHLFGWI